MTGQTTFFCNAYYVKALNCEAYRDLLRILRRSGASSSHPLFLIELNLYRPFMRVAILLS